MKEIFLIMHDKHFKEFFDTIYNFFFGKSVKNEKSAELKLTLDYEHQAYIARNDLITRISQFIPQMAEKLNFLVMQAKKEAVELDTVSDLLQRSKDLKSEFHSITTDIVSEPSLQLDRSIASITDNIKHLNEQTIALEVILTHMILLFDKNYVLTRQKMHSNKFN